MHFLYILYSKSADRYYTGETANMENRLKNHISHRYKKGFTKAAEDWEIVLQLQLEKKEDALFLESFIKKMKSKTFIKKVIENPAILKDVLEKR
ncbi:GIY-YIG nuclease family protein [Salinimicrobium soli]|uniref:GIY-YIG nuclease family protein n=1 Tax=Salinimicrobium soli TaxID=1254399 RepID=UPI003AAFF24C